MSTTEAHHHAGVTCDSCECEPITGVRYKCFVCPNFDFCERCEATVDHPHPFIKIDNPAKWQNPYGLRPQDRVVTIDIDMKDIPNLVKNGLSNIRSEIEQFAPLEADLIDSGVITEACLPESEQTVAFCLQNIGITSIPEGTSVQMTMGDTAYEPTPLAEAVTSEDSFSIDIKFCAPAIEGSYTYKWCLITPDGTKFGPELQVQFEVKEEEVEIPADLAETVAFMVEMGYTAKQAVEILELANGDIGLAISMMPK
jgi:hypothetical protein